MPTNAAHHLGATSKPGPMVVVDPTRLVTDDQLEALAPAAGMNGPFIADMTSDVLTHERGGFHLYRSVAGRTNNPLLKRQYEQHGKEAFAAITAVEELIASLGGDPGYVSPAARATEKAAMANLEASFLLSGSVDLMTQELVMLNAVLVAEAVAHANWSTLAELAGTCPEGGARTALQAAVDQVLPGADRHLTWARDTRQRLMVLQATSKASATVGAKVEEVVDRIRGLFA